MPIDVFIDLSRVPVGFDVAAAVRRLDTPESIGAMARRVTCAIAPEEVAPRFQDVHGWRIEATSPVEACRDALAAAGEEALSLLVLLGDVRPSAAAVGTLLEAVEADPMIGFASARLTGHTAGSIARLDVAGDEFEFADQRGDVAIDEVAAGRFGIKRAVRALLRAEGHVNVEALNTGERRVGHAYTLADLIREGESKPAARSSKNVYSRRNVRSGRLRPVNVLGFETTVTGHDFKDDLFPFVQGLIAFPLN